MKIRFFLFADVQRYSQIGDQDIGDFVDKFLGGIAKILSATNGRGFPADEESTNTWGDAFLFVFKSAQEAGDAALAIRKHVEEFPFCPSGQNSPLGLRIGMHGGPVLDVQNPITKRRSLLGAHINRAARIEPIAEGGQIFVSREFAALSAVENVTSFRCVPQGLADLPKSSGRIPVYRLEPCSLEKRDAQ